MSDHTEVLAAVMAMGLGLSLIVVALVITVEIYSWRESRRFDRLYEQRRRKADD